MFTQLTTTFRLLVLITLAISISACGFQLRGQVNIPNELKVMNLTSESGSDEFDRALRVELIKAGVSIVEEHTEHSTLLTLKVNKITSEDTELARNSSNEVSQLQRRLSTHYFILKNDGKALHGPRKTTTARTLTNQDAAESTKLSYNTEQTQLMHKDLANQIVMDLSYVSP
ncbi:hypothetical protein OFY17_06015 [Marinomonas sp. C2222]|uniref:LPS-assembly lipoprotein LptE n=1 Tax=Marinomonas sargassi TaxID=2984494 RepID=A0ABT2YRC8_9GAMM|nr:hypothetical protein [Marinomonas sargassi]MCV2402444.1 hypothetical protein [Marinomonas sargassi]